ncbi:50S ribosomal protein L7/L12 [Candidatus Deianiraea vastatrix]|uniref:Large ribosomal subunit protein bL12 n=1 Tax=Candidatus Deianiraea vastatrix TaxID=2163644 RepID=A0A5B8XDR0_9RICK|nr:50S ribosomal protein L7/L12 [Candidatus Deianiraea vastatrix]QED23146.1 50S ribosomal protein L7/L12 [Candidatus Deianiraea vastatrix]
MSEVNKIVQTLSDLKVSDMIALVKELESQWGVSATVASAPAASSAAAPAQEKSSFDVILVDGSANKIAAIKVVREITNLGLAEAKALVEGAPKAVKEGLKKEEAEEVKNKLEAAGVKAEIK